jgi:flagellar basal-body rod protein FlgB
MTVTHSLLFSLISARTAWLGQREAVLGQNLANADTPSFKPMDLAAFEKSMPSPGGGMAPVALEQTAQGHLAGTRRPAAAGARSRPNDGYEMAPAGNAVVLEEQMQKLMTTQLDHQLATNLYSRHKSMLKTALGVAQG